MKRDDRFEYGMAPAGATEALDMLARARKAIDEAYGSDEQLARVALHLIDCAADAAVLLSGGGGLETAREALGSARSAVFAATAAVRVVHDATRL